MVKHFVGRPSSFVLIFTLLPGMRLSDGGPIDLEYQEENDGTTFLTSITIPPRFFRLFYVIAMASVEDEAGQIEERFRGYRSTSALRELYAKCVGEVAEVEADAIIAYVKVIRDAIKQAIRDFARERGISPDIDVNPIQRTRGLGYRVGNISIRIFDHR
jgi:hypothetical protein